MANAILLMLCVACFYGSVTNITVMRGTVSMVANKAANGEPKDTFCS